MTDISYKDFFATLSGEKRLDILLFLKNAGEKNVSEIAAGVQQEQSAVSHSLVKLLSCQCVHVEVRGKNRYYSLNKETIVPLLKLADQHIQKFCHKACQHCQTTPK